MSLLQARRNGLAENTERGPRVTRVPSCIVSFSEFSYDSEQTTLMQKAVVLSGGVYGVAEVLFNAQCKMRKGWGMGCQTGFGSNAIIFSPRERTVSPLKRPFCHSV